MVNEKPLGLEQKYGTKVEVLTMPWEDLLPAVASAGPTIDVGFAGMSDYLAQAKNLNSKGDDRVLYLYPSWNFHGGALISFNKNVPELNAQTVKDKELVKKFFSYKIGVQKDSCYHLLLWKLARQNGIDFKNVQVLEATLNDGFLAAENGCLDVAGAGPFGAVAMAHETLERAVRLEHRVAMAHPARLLARQPRQQDAAVVHLQLRSPELAHLCLLHAPSQLAQ